MKASFFKLSLLLPILLVGCSKNTTHESKKTHISENEVVSRGKAISTSKPLESVNSKNASSSDSVYTETDNKTQNKSTNFSSSESVNTDTGSSEQRLSTDIVSPEELGKNTIFCLKGVNVPKAILVDTVNHQITFNPNTDSKATYELSIQDIGVRAIRIFSANTNKIRTVRVSTVLIIGKQVLGNSYPNNQIGNIFLFHNKYGGISMATPNYAGNVPEPQKDIMLEAVQ